MYYFRNSTQDSPIVILDSQTKTGLIKGRATCNDHFLYKVIQKDINDYCERHMIRDISINLESFNVRMAKSLIDVLKRLKKGVKEAPQIHWIYSREDFEMKQMGQYYSHLLSMDFNFMETSSSHKQN